MAGYLHRADLELKEVRHLADIIPFDLVEDDISPSVSAPTGAGIIPFDLVEDDSAPLSDIGGIRNAAVKGLSNAVSFAGEFAPTIERGSAFAPRLFGLSGYLGLDQPEVSPADSGRILSGISRERGVLTDEKPASAFGQVAADVIEQGLSAGPFGPAAMVSSAITSGPGASVGRYFGGETGASIGAVISPFALAGGRALLREGAQKLGPTAAAMTGSKKLTQSVANRAVGETLRTAVDDPIALERALKSARVGPFTTTAEAAGSGPLASIEDAVRASGDEALTGLTAERALNRATQAAPLEDVSKYERAKDIESTLLASSDARTQLAKDKWGLLNREQQLIPDAIDDALNSKISEITFGGDRDLPQDANALLKKWNQIKSDTTSIGKVQDFRSQVLEEGRAAKEILNRNPTNDARLTYKVTSALQKHLDDVVDANVDAGIISGSNADAWRNARAVTKETVDAFSPQFGPKSQATKSALNATDMKDTAALREGLTSPDLMNTQIMAADLGGQDLRPLYQDALKAELASIPQVRWPKYMGERSKQFELAFEQNPQGLRDLLGLAEDVTAETAKNNLARSAFGANSSTFTRGSIDRFLDVNKGIAGAPAWLTGGTTLGAAGYGATEGYKSGDTFPEKVALGLLGGGAGLLGGKVLGGSINRASSAYDAALVDALRNPASGLARLQEAAPGAFGRNVTEALKAAKAPAAARGLQESSNYITDIGKIGLSGREPSDSESNQPLFQPTSYEQTDMGINPIVSKFEGGQKLEAYPPPAKGSGVTVATGIDLGQRSSAELKDLGLPDSLIEKVSPYLGKKDSTAKNYLKSNPLELSQDEADLLDSAISQKISSQVSDKYYEATGQELSDLPEEAKIVLESLAYNFGPNLDQKLPTLWSHVTNNDWEGVQDFLINTKWKQPELKSRRIQEAALLNPLTQVKA